MDSSLSKSKIDIAEPGLISGLQRTLKRNHAQILEAASRKWEHKFAGKDPSDACVSVKVRSVPCAGILRKRRRSLLDCGGKQSATPL